MAKRGHISALIIFLWIAVQSSSQQFFGGSNCLLPRREGPCRARIPRFYYNAREQRCATFYYGGCQGNANNFESYEECEYRCRRSGGHVRYQP
uniref:BPTI/Kunitz inhibitor domain-containing protein n=1 Tax=Plectus sambesii TaxID=2011161 RepID=A0A914XAN7_9BILA